jgi:protein-L-isoaspartate(D-aspartate) O-methyltransferase
MADFAAARLRMVDNQLRTSAVSDHRLLTAMGDVPRELFVPAARRELAYADVVHALGGDRFLGAPAPFARLVQLAEIEHTDTILDIGAGTGYGTGVLARLGAEVTGLEADAALAEAARGNLATLGVQNARVEAGPLDGSGLGRAQFDVIMIEGALDAEPAALFEHLAEGGRLVALVQAGGPAVAMVYVRSGGEVTARSEFNTTLPPLARIARGDTFAF